MSYQFMLGDVETSGLEDGAGVVEAAWADVDDSLSILASGHSLIDPECPISPSASGIHGITYKDIYDKPTLSEFFADHPRDREIILVAHNAAFDFKFFSRELPIVGTLCTLKMARLLIKDSPDHKLQTLRYHLGLESGDAHSALGDVITLKSLVEWMLRETQCSLNELYELSKKPVRIDVMPFGKHRGKPIEALPRDYLGWLLGLPDLDDNLRWTLENM